MQLSPLRAVFYPATQKVGNALYQASQQMDQSYLNPTLPMSDLRAQLSTLGSDSPGFIQSQADSAARMIGQSPADTLSEKVLGKQLTRGGFSTVFNGFEDKRLEGNTLLTLDDYWRSGEARENKGWLEILPRSGVVNAVPLRLEQLPKDTLRLSFDRPQKQGISTIAADGSEQTIVREFFVPVSGDAERKLRKETALSRSRRQ